MQFKPYTKWCDVLAAATAAEINGRGLWYQAPLDGYPVPVLVMKVFKNQKIRLNAGELTFTADESHLDRFRYR